MKFEFIWNGKKAECMGVRVVSLPPIKKSNQRVTEQEVEGRDGCLTEIDGYEADTKQVEADCIGSNPHKVSNWLKGFGEVIFGNMDDRYYKARISNFVPISQIIEKHQYSFPIEFRCQPFGYLLDGKEEITLTSATTLYHNKTDIISLPSITIYGTGTCTFYIMTEVFT
jgi:phage-related protein